MTIPKGGRGKKAPYETQQMRVPTPIKDQVNSLIAKFRGEILDDSKIFENLFNSVDNTQLSLELENLKYEIQNLKTTLEISEAEEQNLKTALQETNQQVNNLSSALADTQLKIRNLSTSLEEEKQISTNLNTGNLQTEFIVNSVIGESEAQKYFNFKREILRTPREKGEAKVTFQDESKIVSFEYEGQPKGKRTSHFWKITKIENAPQNLSLAI